MSQLPYQPGVPMKPAGNQAAGQYTGGGHDHRVQVSDNQPDEVKKRMPRLSKQTVSAAEVVPADDPLA
ncbi:hypothetical protein V4C53_30125 [Paraburkholderia azotifigens]|uniref:hypothetical protein n=1 Tax=Paraburkholderia azotifigens TaxID=2057004 RepID=UPI003179AD1E